MRKELLVSYALLGVGIVGGGGTLIESGVRVNRIHQETPELARTDSLQQEIRGLIGEEMGGYQHFGTERVLQAAYENREFLDRYDSMRRQRDNLITLDHVQEARGEISNIWERWINRMFLGGGAALFGVLGLGVYEFRKLTQNSSN